MTSKLLDGGKFAIANSLIGHSLPVNGMYVAYGPKEEEEAPDADYAYFKALEKKQGYGYARIGITGYRADHGHVLFTAMLTDKDLIGSPIKKGTVLTTGTLVHLDENHPEKDLFIYSSVLGKTPVKVVGGIYMVVNIGLTIGA